MMEEREAKEQNAPGSGGGTSVNKARGNPNGIGPILVLAALSAVAWSLAVLCEYLPAVSRVLVASTRDESKASSRHDRGAHRRHRHHRRPSSSPCIPRSSR